MSWNGEIMSICRKMKCSRAVVEKADYFLRKLNRKTNGTMGAADMLKYLVCVDLAHRDLGMEWDVGVANGCGLKSNQYPSTFTKISNKLNIAKNRTVSFEQLARRFKCSHIKGLFDRKYKEYQTKTFHQLPLIQRQHTNLSTAAHKAAVFYVVATKQGKIGIDGQALCNEMRCDRKKFEMFCVDVKRTCFPPTNSAANTSSRKRGRAEMEMGAADEDNDDMFCDEYQSRRDRKHQKWKESVLREDAKRRAAVALKKNGGAAAESNKRRKVMVRANSAKKAPPTKMFSIFDIKKKSKTTEGKNEGKTDGKTEGKAADEELEEDVDLGTAQSVGPQSDAKGDGGGGAVSEDKENVGGASNRKESAEKEVAAKDPPPMTARDRARMAALKRQQAMMLNSAGNGAEQRKEAPSASKVDGES